MYYFASNDRFDLVPSTSTSHFPQLITNSHHAWWPVTSMWGITDNSTFPQCYSHVWWRICVSQKLSLGNFCTIAKISGEFAKALKMTFLGLKTIYILKCNIWSCNWFPPSLFTHRIILMGVPLWYYVWKTAHLDNYFVWIMKI